MRLLSLVVCVVGCSPAPDIGAPQRRPAPEEEPDAEPGAPDVPDVVDPSDGFCGDGRVDDGEACDLGSGNEVGEACTVLCAPPQCGDGVVTAGEACDDGNADADDGCSPGCAAEGMPLWSATVGGEAQDRRLAAVTAVPGGYVAVSRRWVDFGADDAVLVAVDHDGQERWRRTIAIGSRGDTSDLLAVEDEVIVVGARSAGAGAEQAWTWRYDADGRLIDDGPVAVDDAAEAVAIAPARAGTAWIAGNQASNAGTWVAEVDLADGAVAQVHPPAPLVLRVDDLAAVPDGGYALAGSGQGGAWVARYATSGELRWSATDPAFPFLRGVAVGNDGTVYCTGSLADLDDPQDANVDIYVAAFDDGRLLWSDRVGGSAPQFDFGRDIAVDADGSIWVAGEIQTLAADVWWATDAWLRRYAPDGTVEWTGTHDGALHAADGAWALDASGPIVVAGYSMELFESGNPWLAAYDPAVHSNPGPSPPPPPAPPSEEASPRQGPGAGTLYLDFDGERLYEGFWGPRGESPCVQGSAVSPGYLGTREDAEAIVAIVEDALWPYDIHVTDERPPEHLPYTTVFVGGTAEALGLAEGTVGYSCNVDCGDRWMRDVAFAFDSGSATAIAANVLHEAGHTWGLDHVEVLEHLMFPYVSGGEEWGAGCEPLSHATSDVICGEHHAGYCPDGAQDSDAELRAAFGSTGLDVVAPKAAIHTPQDGDVLPLGEPIAVEVEYSDERGDPGARIVIDSLGWTRVLGPGEHALEVYLPKGPHTIRLDTIDHAGAETTATVTVTVRP